MSIHGCLTFLLTNHFTKVFSLRNNKLTGTMPDEIGELTRLGEFAHYCNVFWICDLSQFICKPFHILVCDLMKLVFSQHCIVYLDLGSNQLSGTIPSFFINRLTNLSKYFASYFFQHRHTVCGISLSWFSFYRWFTALHEWLNWELCVSRVHWLLWNLLLGWHEWGMPQSTLEELLSVKKNLLGMPADFIEFYFIYLHDTCCVDQVECVKSGILFNAIP
jgi:hypothetical protein